MRELTIIRKAGCIHSRKYATKRMRVNLASPIGTTLWNASTRLSLILQIAKLIKRRLLSKDLLSSPNFILLEMYS